MTSQEFKNLKVGDVVVITAHGKNKGKKGLVKEVECGTAYLVPIDCEFEFTEMNRWRLTRKKGLFGFAYMSVQYADRKKSDKTFYVATMYDKNNVEWSTENFTPQELKTIEKFLKELEDHAGNTNIEAIVILDNGD